MNRLAVLGAGNLGAALIAGILKAGIADTAHVTATVHSPERASQLAARFGIPVTAGGNPEAAAPADLIVLAVRPSTIPEVLVEIRDVLHEGQIVVSLAASLPISLIERLVERRIAIFRALPNMPIMVAEGATAIAANSAATAEQTATVEAIFRAVGIVVFVDEDQMHAVTAVASSGPAYIYTVIEAMIAGGIKMGLSREVAARLAEQTVLGAARQVRETGLHPAILRDQVITPGGATIAAMHELEKHGLRSMLISAIETAAHHSENRSRGLIAKFGG